MKNTIKFSSVIASPGFLRAKQSKMTKFCGLLRPQKARARNDVGFCRRFHNHYGFTLIEMCVVILIISIIALIALPSYRYVLARSQEELARAEILRMITLAQKTAITKHAPIIICKTKDFLQCNGSWRDGEIIAKTTHQTDQINDGQIKERDIIYSEFARGVLYWQSYPRYRKYIMFMPTGLLASDNATFWYCAKDKSSPAFAVFLSKSGRTHVVLPDHDGVIRDSKQRVLRCYS